MSLLKPALCFAVVLGLGGCATTVPLDLGEGASVTSRSARMPGVLSEIDIVRAVQSSL